MSSRGLFRAFTGSILFHALLVAVSIIVVRHSGFKRAPSPYIVSLVSAPSSSSPSPSKESDNSIDERSDVVTKNDKPLKQPPLARKQKTDTRENELLVNERIAALQAKKQVERSAHLRKIIEIDSQRQAERSSAHAGQQARKPGGQDTAGGNYDSTVTEMIRRQWIFPENIDRDLEAIVSIRVGRDGSITVQKVEKSSGSPLFDRTVLRAIAKAGPLPQPPKELEIIVRFRP